ncbi:YkgJ family cysteine cluster protein [Undibacterium sp. TJN19]|uniref:YkgJ family cysteine cluster protein n=1 Tax=Undibacterium sp. TJN19 TaxID=3413055 RepID=UPI003BF3B985
MRRLREGGVKSRGGAGWNGLEGVIDRSWHQYLGQSMLTEEEQDAFLESIQTVRRHIAIQLMPVQQSAMAVAHIGKLHKNVDQLLQDSDKILAPLACQAGCAHCCHVRVSVSQPEVFHILTALRQHSDMALDSLIQRLRQYVETSQHNSLHIRQACAFLVDNLCSIYSHRPAVCRKAHSLSVSACASGAEHIPQDLQLILRAEALIQGHAAAYEDAGLPAASHELASAVLLALADAQAQETWFAGKRAGAV